MLEQQWKKKVTVRLSDGFYMYRKVLEPINDNRLSKHKVVQREKIFTRNYNSANEDGRHTRDEKASLDKAATQFSNPGITTPETKSFIGLPTPGRPIPSDVSTPISIAHLQKFLPKECDNLANSKGQQFPSPYLGPNAISLAKQLIRDVKRAEKRKRRREKRAERRKKRQKVITRYLSMHIPSFPLPKADELRRQFVCTEEARLAASNPKNAFVRLTQMIVDSQMKSINQVYGGDGPFSFISKACLGTLDLFQEKLVEYSADNAITRFSSFSRKLPRELELEDAVKCIKERQSNVCSEVANLEDFKEKVECGSHLATLFEKIYPLPQLELEESKFVEEELKGNTNLILSHEKLSQIVLENITVKLTKRWLLYEDVLKERLEQRRMRKVYDREIANVVLPTLETIKGSLRAISAL